MNWLEQNHEIMQQNEETVIPNLPPNSAATLFMGDTGELPSETRRALVLLLKGPAVEARHHPKLWPVLRRDEALLRSRLAELFLDLVIDLDLQIAFTRQADTGDLEAPLLLRRLPLTFMDSVLLLYLRQQLAQADAQGLRAVLARQEIKEQLAVYRVSTNTDHAGFTRQVETSIKKMQLDSILRKISGSEDRFEISPILKLLFSAEEIQALTRRYQSMVVNVAAEPNTNKEVVQE